MSEYSFFSVVSLFFAAARRFTEKPSAEKRRVPSSTLNARSVSSASFAPLKRNEPPVVFHMVRLCVCVRCATSAWLLLSATLAFVIFICCLLAVFSPSRALGLPSVASRYTHLSVFLTKFLSSVDKIRYL